MSVSDPDKTPHFREHWNLILTEISAALESVDPAQVQLLVEAMLKAGTLFFTGVGRVALSLQAMVKRLNHLGFSAWFVGDLAEPAASAGDLLVVGSGSGESVVPVAIAKVAKRHGARVAHIGSNPESALAPLTDIFLRIPVATRLRRPDEIPSQQIMTSVFDQALYILGDAIALELLRRKGIVDLNGLWQRHANLE
jgi:6-phospho-3-hexuloisomerase